MKKIIVSLLFALQTCFAQELCINSIEIKGALVNSKMTYRLEACQLDNSPGNLKVKLQIKNDQVIVYEYIQSRGDGYTPSVENQLDINYDGVPDFSLSNGNGKAGDGRDYFLVLNKPPYFHKIGDFPILNRDKNKKSILFAVIPGSAENIATRIDYIFDNDNLNQVRAISYSQLAENKFKVDIKNIRRGQTVNVERKVWPESKIITCMAGGKC